MTRKEVGDARGDKDGRCWEQLLVLTFTAAPPSHSSRSSQRTPLIWDSVVRSGRELGNGEEGRNDAVLGGNFVISRTNLALGSVPPPRCKSVEVSYALGLNNWGEGGGIDLL